jgi:hypothetical protein
MISKLGLTPKRRGKLRRTRLIRLTGALLTKAVLPWLIASAAAVVLLLVHPLPGQLDRGSILAIAGFILAIVALTFGLVTVLYQHLAETYARSVVRAVDRGSMWKSTVVTEAVALAVAVGLALWRPDLTSGLVASALGLASLVESWFAIRQLFDQFDPTSLILLMRDAALLKVAQQEDKAAAPIASSQAILNLILVSAARGDVEVISVGLESWNEILRDYLSSASIVFDDEFLTWLYARSHELTAQYAKESVGLVLPVVVDGIAALGRTTASYRNPLNQAVDDGTAFFTDVLKSVVLISGRAPRSPAADRAVLGIGSIGSACIAAGKFEVLQFPIDELTAIGKAAAEPAQHVASRAVTQLTHLAIELAETDSRNVMCSADAESAVKGIRAIVPKGRGNLSPAHFLTAPMATDNLPRLCQLLARAAARTGGVEGRSWDSIAWLAADLAANILEDPAINPGMRWNSVQAAGSVILGLLAVGRPKPYLTVIRRICKDLAELAVTDDGRLSADEVLAPVLLLIYESSRETGEPELKIILEEAAQAIKGADPQMRSRLAPIARQLGATALHRGDRESATLMAQASVLRSSSASRQVETIGDAFSLGGSRRLAGGMARPELQMPAIPDDYLDEDTQKEFLALEREMHTGKGE